MKILRDFLIRKEHLYYHRVYHGDFTGEYSKAERDTHTKRSQWRRDRFFNLLSFLKATREVEGEIVELGVSRGLSALLICRELQKFDANFSGAGLHLFDSFEGLSAQGYDRMFACPLATVKGYLSEYQAITYHEGRIPETFKELSEAQYRFVHVDLDLPEPTLASFEYFYPRLVEGGFIICDDYGATQWGKTRRMLDMYINDKQVAMLSTGQLLLCK